MVTATHNPTLLGIDTGGTFTDFVLVGKGAVRLHKVLSTPAAPEQAILQGVAELGLTDVVRSGKLAVVHGSTVATNAALEGKGVRTVYITNRGFADVLSIGRQARSELYNLCPHPVPEPVPAELCLETGGRLGADGTVVEPLTEADLAKLTAQVQQLAPESVAINLLFSFLDDRFERAIEAAMPQGLFVSRSSYVLPEYREYERGIATWLNAWLGPLVARYLQRLQQGLAPAPLAVMQSSGGTCDAAQAGTRAVNLLLSGPAGGLAAARYMTRLLGGEPLLTFDMGGTSTDVAMVDGDIRLTSEGKIGPWPVAVPMVDMHTIGAGGGSLAWLDSGGLLQVGPESAGADPGPACYGRGGRQATVTDANAVLGRLPESTRLGGKLALDFAAARAAIAELAGPLGAEIEETAAAVIDLANENMVRALRVISVQRGLDPRDFRLCCFGGAGGLHLCALADALGMQKALIPVHGGVLSALGMLVAPRERQLSRTLGGELKLDRAVDIEQALQALTTEGRGQLLAEGADPDQLETYASLDLRYQGQTFALNVPWQGNIDAAGVAFAVAHEQRYGHQLERSLELVNVRLAIRAPGAPVELPELESRAPAQVESEARLWGEIQPVPVYGRPELVPGQQVAGPALIRETVATSYIAPGWRAEVDRWGNLLLERV